MASLRGTLVLCALPIGHPIFIGRSPGGEMILKAATDNGALLTTRIDDRQAFLSCCITKALVGTHKMVNSPLMG
jgi:hypothetical protein